MRFLFLLALIAAPALAADAPRDVMLLANFQNLGVEPAAVQALDTQLRAALSSRPLEVLNTGEAEKNRRALVMCGEDAACQATVGQQAQARWVLSYGVGTIGPSTLVSAQLIDVKTSRAITSTSRKETSPTWSKLAGSIVDELLRDVPLSVPELVVGDLPPPIIVNTVVVTRPFRTVAIVTGVVTAAFTAATVVLGIMAKNNFAVISHTPLSERMGEVINQQNRLNLGADLLLTGAIVAAAATVVMIILDAKLGVSGPEQ